MADIGSLDPTYPLAADISRIRAMASILHHTDVVVQAYPVLGMVTVIERCAPGRVLTFDCDIGRDPRTGEVVLGVWVWCLYVAGVEEERAMATGSLDRLIAEAHLVWKALD